MSFNVAQSESDSDKRENLTIDFIKDVFKGTHTKVKINQCDKEASIDGTIELLDSNGYLRSIVHVQAKTVSPSNESKFSYLYVVIEKHTRFQLKNIPLFGAG